MSKATFELLTPDKIKIHGVHWKTDNPQAVLCLVHGFGEHVERYDHLAAWFGNRGFATIGYDRRGHGQSGGKLGHTPSYEAYLQEIDMLMDEADKCYPDLPKIIYGHSQGGNLVLSYVIDRKPKVNGFVVTGPWIKLAFEPPKFLVMLGKVMKSVYPKFNNKNQLDTSHISRDPVVVKKYEDDPLVHDNITANTGMEMMNSAEKLDAFSGTLPIPGLIMHGEEDKVTSRPASEEFHKRIKGDVKLKIWSGMYHEIHNEPEKEDVFKYTLDWLKTVL